ncbi:viroplasmin and RNaseH domain-containing protein [Lachnospiraceae bacterium PM6-15]|uniref:ribonuclease H n=1 Tax=Ohessyouella blattaphilus TaxID=2949333 RepID=A0ABT1EM13_9FIRM|nr:viroplasmin family protein [Ohessyouella blattaphilus]MCP1111561.1 viroplasmin family protein [Ohessyouella blattaphilus]MCR8564955.1 viroplasmin family protein [Ohessyouella blattaphilus]
MTKNKFYAVKVGRKPGVYTTWPECQEQINGFSGAEFKSFKSLSEAEKYMSDEVIEDVASSEDVDIDALNLELEKKIGDLGETESIAFVDGSYDASEEKSGFGVILLSYDNARDTLYKAFTKQLGEEFIKTRNVGAELEGVKEAINWAITSGKSKITICYDYQGIEEWAVGNWKAKNEIAKKYVSFIRDKRSLLDIEFIKVPAHSGINYNEEADALAKKSLLTKGHKTYNDGSVYFTGYGVKDWRAIVELLNEENEELVAEDDVEIEKVEINIEELSNRHRIVVSQTAKRVVINCYSNSNSYVQGKQSVLFQKIISTAIEMLRNDQGLLETLNTYHALQVTKEEVEVGAERYLPHFSGDRKSKLYRTLLAAVYNTMLTGYMPDYTSLVTPIFRAYEYYLHQILGSKMGLCTENKNGKNNFAFFNKDDNGRFECNSKKIDQLSSDQVKFLNDFYSNYNNVRHQYSHWSADDYDTSVISEMGDARELIIKGLTLIDKYYTLF